VAIYGWSVLRKEDDAAYSTNLHKRLQELNVQILYCHAYKMGCNLVATLAYYAQDTNNKF
jgi:hypothetical protein